MNQEMIMSICSMSLSLLAASVGFLVTYFKTKQANIEKKVDKSLNDTSNISLKNYYVEIDNKKYYLSDLKLYKEVKLENEKTIK